MSEYKSLNTQLLCIVPILKFAFGVNKKKICGKKLHADMSRPNTSKTSTSNMHLNFPNQEDGGEKINILVSNSC